MGDEQLEKLVAAQDVITAQIRERKKEIAKENKQIVGSIDELACEKHPDGKFKAIGTIPDSHIFSRGTEGKYGLNIYQCEPCGNDLKIFRKSTAYDCPNCGIVVGEVIKRHYKSDEDSWRNLAGREGDHYYCRVCNMQLGSNYWHFS
ncbi:MAG: hypothetical protein V1743_03020 [Nanoarchaeota archaeon]